jgi:hypothetical protein
MSTKAIVVWTALLTLAIIGFIADPVTGQRVLTDIGNLLSNH